MKIFKNKNKISKILSQPPVMIRNYVPSGYYRRTDTSNNTTYIRAIMPYVDTLSAERPIYKYPNSVTVLSAGWARAFTAFGNPYLTDNTSGNDSTYTAPYSSSNVTVFWKEIVTNRSGLTSTNMTSLTTVRVVQYPPTHPTSIGSNYFGLTGDNYNPSADLYPIVMVRDQSGSEYRSKATNTDQLLSGFAYVVDDITRKYLYPNPITIKWCSNLNSTGESTNQIPFNNTQNGEAIYCSITATNFRGSYTFNGVSRFVDSNLYNLTSNIVDSVTARTTGYPGGSASMNVFSVKNHTTKNYTRNPNFWAKDLVPQLASCAVYKCPVGYDNSWQNFYESYGGVLITPRHLLYCQHGHPIAGGTWSYTPSSAPTEIRFVKSDNTPISAIQLHQADDSNVADLCVAVLDKDMTQYGLSAVPIYPIDNIATPFATSNTYYGAKTAGMWDIAKNGFPYVAMSQGYGRQTNSTPPNPASQYSSHNDIMFYIKPVDSNSSDILKLSAFNYNVWDGDSGTPVFLIIDNKLYLTGIMVTAPFGFVRVSYYINHINTLIAQADANAIAMGRLDAPTGYTVSLAPDYTG